MRESGQMGCVVYMSEQRVFFCGGGFNRFFGGGKGCMVCQGKKDALYVTNDTWGVRAKIMYGMSDQFIYYVLGQKDHV